MSTTLEIPSEEQMIAVKAKNQLRKDNVSASGPGAIPSWKLTRSRHVYTLGGLSLALRALPRRPAALAYEAVRSTPIMLQIAAQCGLESETRLDFERAALILTAFKGEDISADLASAAWRDFVTSDEFSDGVGLLADALFPFLDDANAQGYAWPRPVQTAPAEGADPEAGLSEYEALVARSLPAGCRWLDDAIEEELHELEVPLLLTLIFDIQGGYPGDIRSRFTQP